MSEHRREALAHDGAARGGITAKETAPIIGSRTARDDCSIAPSSGIGQGRATRKYATSASRSSSGTIAPPLATIGVAHCAQRRRHRAKQRNRPRPSDEEVRDLVATLVKQRDRTAADDYRGRALRAMTAASRQAAESAKAGRRGSTVG